MLRKFVLGCFGVAIALAALTAADRVAGMLSAPEPRGSGILFRPNSRLDTVTTEFRYTAETNSLGFRDREFAADGRPHPSRIAAVGDSFTYGWGVDIEDAWPKRLERLLRAAGQDVEVADLGQPAAAPRDYATIVERAMPLLGPSTVIIAVVCGDDLEQTAPDEPPTPAPRRIEPIDRSDVVGWLFPTFWRWREAGRPAIVSADEQAAKWSTAAKLFLDSSPPEAVRRFEALDDDIKTPFLAGRLNPWMVFLSLRDRDWLMRPLDPDSADTRARVESVVRQFLRIKVAAARDGARVIVVAIPFGPYVDRAVIDFARRLGFELDETKMLTSTAPEDELAEAARRAGFEFVRALANFRRLSANGGRPYFPRDGHLTPQGLGELAAGIFRVLH
jgi:hypothetical protein